MFESSQAPWSLEELGYAYDAPHFYTDGRIESGLHPPEYYAYSPHPGNWQDGLQDIDDFDWPNEKYEHRLYETQESSVQDPGDILALEGAVSPLATTSGDSSVPPHEIPDQTKPYQPEVNLGDHVQNLDWLSLATANTPVSDTSISAALFLPPTLPPWVPDPSPGQVPNNSVAPSHTSLGAQTEVVEVKEQSDKVSDGMDVDRPFVVTGLDGVRTSLVDRYDPAKQQIAERNSEAPFQRDEKSINAEITSGNNITCCGNSTDSVEVPAPSTLRTAETSNALPSPDTQSEQLLQERSEAELINDNPMPLEILGCTRIAEDVVSTGGRLEELSRFQTKDNREEERMPEPAEPAQDPGPLCSVTLPPQGNAQDIPHKSSLGTGSSNAVALPAANPPKSPIGKMPNSLSPENLARVEDDVGAQWQAQLRDAADKVSKGISGLVPPGPVQRDLDSSKKPSMKVGNSSPAQERPAWPAQWLEQQYANSMTLPPPPFQPDENRNDKLGSETSSLSDAPSFEARATLELTPDGLARNLTTVIQAGDADTDRSMTEGQEIVVAPVNAEAPTKTLRLRLKVSRTDLSKRSQPAKEIKGTSDTDPDAPPKKRQKQGAYGAYTGPSPHAPMNLSGQIVLGTEDELQQPDNDDGDTEEHYRDVETPTTPPGQAFLHIQSTKTPGSQPKVSASELEDPSPKKCRERPSKSRKEGKPIARQLFASQKKPDTLGTLMMSTKALGESPAVTRNEDTLILVKDAGTAESTSKVSTRSKAKPRSVAAKTKREGVIKAQRVAKKAPASRVTRKKRITVVEEEPESFSPRKTGATKGAEEKQPTAPPNTRNSTARATRRKEHVARDAEKDERLVFAEEEFPADDDPEQVATQDMMKSASEYADSPETLEETMDTPTSEADDPSSCDTTAAAAKKSISKDKTLSLGAHTASYPKQPNDTPGPSIISSYGTPGANKYGFTPPRGPKALQPRKAAGTRARSALHPKPTVTMTAPSKTRAAAARAKAKDL